MRQRARIVKDMAIREQLAVKGKLPDFAIFVAVEQMFFHCAKCTIRSGLWSPDAWPALAGLATLAETLVSAGKPVETVEQLQEQIDSDAATNLYGTWGFAPTRYPPEPAYTASRCGCEIKRLAPKI